DRALFRGYSFTGGASMHAVLGQGDTALTRLNLYLDAPRYMEPNTFYAEAGPVIETPLSAATSIQDLFLQDWGGTLRVFPAMPAAWTEAAFDRLRTEGAFVVSAVRHDGRTAWVRIESLAGQPCRLVVPDWEWAVVRTHTGPAPKVTKGAAGDYVIDVPKGGSVVLAPDATTSAIASRGFAGWGCGARRLLGAPLAHASQVPPDAASRRARHPRGACIVVPGGRGTRAEAREPSGAAGGDFPSWVPGSFSA